MSRTQEKRALRREIARELDDMAEDPAGIEYALDWGLIGRCRECDGLQEDGECLEGGPFGCSRAERSRAWERAYASGIVIGLDGAACRKAANAAREAVPLPP